MARKRRQRDIRTRGSFPREMESRREITAFFLNTREVIALIFLAILVLVIYSNTLRGPFIFDDGHNIRNNPHIRMTSLTWEGIRKAGFESPGSHRPVANISFALNYRLHQYDVLGYHLVNILIHIATGIFFYLFAITTLSLPSLRSKHEPVVWIPFMTVLVWIVHPIHSQSVAYIVQRMNSMAAMFYILAFLLYVRGRLAENKSKKRALFAGCVVAAILSLGSKEIAATLPFFILLYEWYFFQGLDRAWLKRHLFPFVGLLTLLCIIALMYLGSHPWETILKSYEARDFTLTQRVMTEFRVLIFYVSLLIFPHPSRLNLDPDFPISHSLFNPLTTIISIGAIVGFFVFAIYVAKRDRLLSFCILWFLGNLVIESSVIGLEIIFEHRTYLPSMLVTLMAVTVLCRYVRLKWWGAAGLCAVVMVFSFWTYERNTVWRDDVTLWRDCVEKSPKKARPHNNLGFSLAKKGRHKEAIGHFYKALRIKPKYADALNNLGSALKEEGRPQQAIPYFHEVLKIEPKHAEAHYGLGNALVALGRLKKATEHYAKALSVRPNYEKAHHNLGVVLARQGNLEQAMSHFSKALQINPDFAIAHHNLGNALKSQGRLKEALDHFSEALRIEPDYSEAHHNLGNALVALGRPKEAAVHYSEVLRIKPDHAEAHYNLGVVLARQGNLEQAIRHFLEALQINPDYAKAHMSLGVALKQQGKIKQAIRHFSQALRINPDNREARQHLEMTPGLTVE